MDFSFSFISQEYLEKGKYISYVQQLTNTNKKLGLEGWEKIEVID